MITVTTIANLNYSLYDEVWAIVRSLKYPNPNIKHVPELSPSWSLFGKYQALKKAGQWNDETFRSVYVPQFLKEMKGKEQRKLLNYLTNTKKHICLVCFCQDECLCHRSIVGGMLQGAGIEVQGLYQDYSYYFDWWKNGVPGIPVSDTVANDKKITDYNNNVKYLYKGETPFEKRRKTLCFTGRRPKNLCWYESSKYRTFVDDLMKILYEEFYVKQGIRRFISGGVQGFDQMAFWAVNKMQKVYKCEDVENVVFVPFEHQESRWAEKGLFSQAEYWMMIENADMVAIISEENTLYALFDRNHAMCDSSDIVLGLYADNSWRTEKGGTAECLRYAAKQPVDTFLLNYQIDALGLHAGTLTKI